MSAPAREFLKPLKIKRTAAERAASDFVRALEKLERLRDRYEHAAEKGQLVAHEYTTLDAWTVSHFVRTIDGIDTEGLANLVGQFEVCPNMPRLPVERDAAMVAAYDSLAAKGLSFKKIRKALRRQGWAI